MNPEQEAFQRKSIILSKLIPFGFKKCRGGYVFKKDFMDGKFRAEVYVDKKGTVTGKVVDLDVNEEYLPIRVDSRTGAFVRSVRQAYAEILQQIADACCMEQEFLYPQTNRIARQIELLYGEKADYPFVKYPDYAVFRYPVTKKWYGLVGPLPKKTLLLKINLKSSDNTIVEILNLKIDPQRREELLATPGIFRCYHMNQNSWVSVILDDTLPDEKIMELVETSRNIIVSSKKRSSRK